MINWKSVRVKIRLSRSQKVQLKLNEGEIELCDSDKYAVCPSTIAEHIGARQQVAFQLTCSEAAK